MSTTALSVSCYVGATTSGQRRGRGKLYPPRAALVEAKPRQVPALSGGGSGGDENGAVTLLRVRDSSSSSLSSSSFRDRADDMQAEAAAMARAANASVYSPEFLASKYGSRPIKVVRRALEIFAGLGSFAFNLWLDQANGKLDQNQRLRAVHLRKTFTRLGPTFVKIGQGLSTRPDLCPPQYLEELSQLQVPSLLFLLVLNLVFALIFMNSFGCTWIEENRIRGKHSYRS